MTPSESWGWAFFSVFAGVVTILLGCIASTMMVSGVASDLLCITSAVLAGDGICLIGCGLKCARLAATLEEQAEIVRKLSQRLAALDRSESADPDTRIKPAP